MPEEVRRTVLNAIKHGSARANTHTHTHTHTHTNTETILERIRANKIPFFDSIKRNKLKTMTFTTIEKSTSY